MDWMYVFLVTLLLFTKISGQGYKYPSPQTPFGSSQSQSGLPSSTPASFPGSSQPNGGSEGQSTQIPSGSGATLLNGNNNGFPSPGYPSAGRPSGPSFPQGPGKPTNGYRPQGVQGSQYPGQQGNGGFPAQSSQQSSGYPSGSPGHPGQPEGGRYPSGSRQQSQGYPGQQGGYASERPQGSQGTLNQPGGTYPTGTGGQSQVTQGGSDAGGTFPGQQGFPGQGQNNQYPGPDGAQPSDFGVGGSTNGDLTPEEEGDYSAIPGEPDVDYPILSVIPETAFRCEEQQYPGYYADVETRCQVFHICANNKTFDFLCPNGTIFHQEYLVCVWWNQFDCNSAPSLFNVNANLYDYSITGAQQQTGGNVGAPSFGGEEYTGSQSGGSSPGYPLSGPSNQGNNEKLPGSINGGYQPTGPGSNNGGGYPSQASNGYPSGPQSTSNAGGYPSQSSTGYPSGPQSSSQGTFGFTGGYPSQGPNGYPSYPQNAKPGTSAGGGYPSQGINGYPKGPQSPLPESSNAGNFPSQTSIGYPSGPQDSSSRPSSSGGYPSQGSNGYPSGPSGQPSSAIPQKPVTSPQAPNYQQPGSSGSFPFASPTQGPGYLPPRLPTSNEYGNGQSKPTNGFPQKPGSSYGNDSKSTSGQVSQPTDQGYPSEKTESYPGGAGNNDASAAYPSSGDTQPTREYLPPLGK